MSSGVGLCPTEFGCIEWSQGEMSAVGLCSVEWGCAEWS